MIINTGTILVVDDDATNRLLLAASLEEQLDSLEEDSRELMAALERDLAARV